MKITAVDAIPKRDYRKKRWDTKIFWYLEQFMKLGCKCAKVELEEGEYANVTVAASCIRGSVIHYDFPIRVVVVNQELYLERFDMED